MKKKIAIIGAGIAGLVFANLLKSDGEFEFIIFEKNSSLNLDGGYGVQLSVNSISILNTIGFKNIKASDKFNPKKIDFYTLKNNKKICDLNISHYNFENTYYSTLKRSVLIQNLKDKLFTNSIQFNKKISKINQTNNKIEITFEGNVTEIFDYLIISDGIFSPTKSILLKKNIKPTYFGSLAFRTLLEKRDLDFINADNISLFLGSNVHIVAYPINNKNVINLVFVLRKKIKKETLKDKSFFENKDNIRELINQSSIQENSNLKNLFNNIKDLNCFPIFVSDKIRKNELRNIFFIGDAFYASPPVFAQGASQSVEAANDLFDILKVNNENSSERYFFDRVERIKMIDRRSKLNHLIFHISNPILVLIRNVFLKIIVNNKIFLNKYLGKIYLKK